MTRRVQLGRAVGLLIAFRRSEEEMHADVDAFHAPSECHGVVALGEARRYRAVRRLACRVAGVRNLRLLRRRVRAAMPQADFYFYRRFGFVPY